MKKSKGSAGCIGEQNMLAGSAANPGRVGRSASMPVAIDSRGDCSRAAEEGSLNNR